MTAGRPIAFEYASSEPGDERLRCPVCQRTILRHEEESFYRAGSDARIQCCTDCREDFERSSGHTIDGDVLDTTLFDAFRDWALQEIEFDSDQP